MYKYEESEKDEMIEFFIERILSATNRQKRILSVYHNIPMTDKKTDWWHQAYTKFNIKNFNNNLEFLQDLFLELDKEIRLCQMNYMFLFTICGDKINIVIKNNRLEPFLRIKVVKPKYWWKIRIGSDVTTFQIIFSNLIQSIK